LFIYSLRIVLNDDDKMPLPIIFISILIAHFVCIELKQMHLMFGK